jgi:hypothetical protein
MAGQAKIPVKVAPGVLRLDQTEREWVTAKWRLIRESQQQADEASNRWEQLAAEVDDYMDRSGLADPLARARVREENLALAEFFAAGRWFGQVAQRHIDDMDLFLRMKELGLL